MLSKLHQYRDELIQNEISSYNDEYKNSKWYKEPTLKEILPERLYADYSDFEKTLAEGRKVKGYIAIFESAAHEYGSSWWDDDLCTERTGYEFETEFYCRLRNIVAEEIGISTREFTDFYNGRGV